MAVVTDILITGYFGPVYCKEELTCFGKSQTVNLMEVIIRLTVII